MNRETLNTSPESLSFAPSLAHTRSVFLGVYAPLLLIARG